MRKIFSRLSLRVVCLRACTAISSYVMGGRQAYATRPSGGLVIFTGIFEQRGRHNLQNIIVFLHGKYQHILFVRPFFCSFSVAVTVLEIFSKIQCGDKNLVSVSLKQKGNRVE